MSAAGIRTLKNSETLGSSPYAAVSKVRALVQRQSAKPYPLAFPSVLVNPPTTAWTNPGGSSPINSGSPTIVPWKTSRVTALGAVLTKYANAQAGTNSVNAAWSEPQWAAGFDYYGSDFALRLINRGSASEVWVWVDGQPITATPEVLSQAASNSFSYYRVTFAAAGQHRVVAYFKNFALGGVDIGATDSVTATPKPFIRVSVLGDSWVEATGATYGINGVFPTLGRMWDVELFQHGQGGTGYANDASTNGKAVYGDADRIAGVALADPHLIIVSGSSNDDAYVLASEPATVFAALRSACPTAKVLVIGPPMLTSTNITQRLANRDIIKAAAAAAPNVLGFIDPLDPRGAIATAPAWVTATTYAVGDLVTSGGFVYECRVAHTSGASISSSSFITTTWITGSGKVGSTNGTGNSDIFINSDATHPSTEGHEFLAHIYSEEIMKLLNTTAAFAA